VKHLLKIYVTIFLFIIGSIVYLYFSIDNTQNKLSKNVSSLFITKAEEFAKNIKGKIENEVQSDIVTTLYQNTQLREKLEIMLYAVTTDSYKYVYVLYKDKNGEYRYLLDGSMQDKGEFGEKLNVDSQQWDKVFTTQKSNLLVQDKLDSLWVTYLSPIVLKDKTEAILAMDFSPELPNNIKKALKPLKNIFIYIFISIFLILLLLLYQIILNIRTKKDSITDQLTEVYNRNYLRDLLKTININHYQIMMLDIDYFKKVNDSYGHKTGDYVLKSVASRIKKEIREQDILIRFGGEEFLLFIYNKDAIQEQAFNIGERIKQRVSASKFLYDEYSIHVTISIGISSTPGHFKTITEAIKAADSMLYIAKKEGRNLVICDKQWDSKKNKNSENIFHITEIKEAIEEDRLLCYYQPIFSAKSQTICKYEALVRLIDKEGKIVLPWRFIETILHTNIYNQMTKKILDIVFKNIAKHKVEISVNLNFSDILNQDTFALIISELEENTELASWLTIELLEYEVLESGESFIKNINQIRAYGVKIAIDDFGTGFANYTVFHTLPIDIIKLDASLIKNIDKSEISRKIVKSLLLLMQELEIETVAEFVHSQEILDIVTDLGATYLQGFYLAEPMPYLLEV